MRATRAIIAISFLVSGHSALGQSVDPELTAAIRGRDEAAIKRDPAALAKYTADDYASIAPNGARMTKQQRVDQLKAPAAPGSKPAPPLRVEAIHMYGASAAVVRMRQVDSRQLAVWIKSASGWQAAAIHVVPDAFTPPPRPPDPPKTPMPSNLSAPAGLSGERATLYAAFKEIQEAVDRGDRATYDKYLAPEYARLSPGMLRFYTENSAGFSQPRVPPKHSNITVQVWGQVGVVRWHEASASGAQQWLTRAFVKKGSGWQQVATASSVSANPPIQP